MPAETHQRRDPVETRTVLDLFARVRGVGGVDEGGGAHRALVDLELDAGGSHLRRWASAVEACGARSIDEVELAGGPPTTFGEPADVFTESQRS